MLKLSSILIVLVFGFWSLVFGFEATSANFKSELKTLAAIESFQLELYQQNCARCHGVDGKGETEAGETYEVPNIADANWQRRHSDKKIASKIIKGGGGMPAYGKKLSSSEIKSLVDYVRSLKE
jgi:cytochrome c5